MPQRTIDQNVKTLIHGDGMGGDYLYPNIYPGGSYVNGTALSMSATKQKFGLKSMYFGASTWIRVPYSSITTVPTGDWTCDFWMNYVAASNTDKIIVGWCDSGSNQHSAIYSKGDGKLAIGRFGVNEVATASSVTTDNTWHHIAVTYDGTTTKLYVDGVEKISTTTAVWGNAASHPLCIGGGYYASDRGYTGYLTEVRISPGYRRWTAEFSGSLPTAPERGRRGWY